MKKNKKQDYYFGGGEYHCPICKHAYHEMSTLGKAHFDSWKAVHDMKMNTEQVKTFIFVAELFEQEGVLLLETGGNNKEVY